jgi:hypothetical protein
VNNKKFRVWDKLEKKFIYPDKGYQGHYILSLDGKFHNLQNGSGGSEYDVQQFIGILDKNMKEVYEGDVVETDDGLGEVVYFHDHCAYGINTDISFSLFLTLSLKNIEVVGNMKESYIYDEKGTLMTREDYEKITHT